MAPVTNFRSWRNLVDRGWGSMSRGRDGRWTFVPQTEQMVTVPGVTGKVHRRIAPLVAHLLVWLVANRRRALDAEGNWGLAVRPIRGRETAAYAGNIDAWSNHSGGVAVDIEAPRNGLGVFGRGDFPPGWEQECHRWGFAWGASVRDGGDYLDRPDRMHIEFIGTPAQADEYCAALSGTATARPTGPAPAKEPVTMRQVHLDNPGSTPRRNGLLTIDGVGTSLVMPKGARVWLQYETFYPDAQDAIARLTWLVLRIQGGKDVAQDPRDLPHRAFGAIELPPGCTAVELAVTGLPIGGVFSAHLDGIGHG